MGLDIFKNREGKEVDYFRFNWTGCNNFKEWCDNMGLPTPFPGWSGGNDGDPIDHKAAQEWVKAYENKFPSDAKMGVAHAMREIMFRVNASRDAEPFYKKEFLDWERNTALAWYWFVKDLDKDIVIEFC